MGELSESTIAEAEDALISMRAWHAAMGDTERETRARAALDEFQAWRESRAPVPSGWRAMSEAPPNEATILISIRLADGTNDWQIGFVSEGVACDAFGPLHGTATAWRELPAPFTGNPEDLR